MGEYAPPATRYGFYHCNGVFWPDVGNSNRHERAKVSTLKSLLQPPTPQSIKSGKPSKRNIPPPPPDPAGHWYEAQLLHYGLKPSKDKQTAKKRLLKAIEEETLIVPTFVATLEGELKKEWNTANKQAEARLKREKREKEEIKSGSRVEVAKREYERALKEQEEAAKAERLALGESSPAKKRKASTKKETPNQNEPAEQPSAKKPVAEKKLTTKKEPAKKKDPPKKPLVKKDAAKKEPAKKSAKRSFSEFLEEAETNSQQAGSTSARPKQTARRGNYSNFTSRPRPSNPIPRPAKREIVWPLRFANLEGPLLLTSVSFQSPSDYEYGDPMDIDDNDYNHWYDMPPAYSEY
ncbi:MAG: hypothetical protein M1835_007802 [Candelina submexicana]|nr:MAG: hypothetical protein M1835_007802 [Candelina submexicana]